MKIFTVIFVILNTSEKIYSEDVMVNNKDNINLEEKIKDLQEGYITLSVNYETFVDDFYPALISSDEESVFLELDFFISMIKLGEFIKIEDEKIIIEVPELYIKDLKTKRKWEIEKNEVLFEIDGKKYLDIRKFYSEMNNKINIWSEKQYKIAFNFPFFIPKEFDEYRAEMRERSKSYFKNELKNPKDYSLNTPFSFGNIELGYNITHRFEKKSEIKFNSPIYLNYNSQFLFGELDLSSNIKDNKIIINNYTLKYQYLNSLKNKVLTFGKISSSGILSELGTSIPSLDGISLNNSSINSFIFGSELIIEDKKDRAVLIELYKEDRIIDYQESKDGTYKFTINFVENKEYYLRFYDSSGNLLEESRVNTIDRENSAKKGESDINFTLGQDSKNEVFYSISHKYGISDKLTLLSKTYNTNFNLYGSNSFKKNDYVDLEFLYSEKFKKSYLQFSYRKGFDINNSNNAVDKYQIKYSSDNSFGISYSETLYKEYLSKINFKRQEREIRFNFQKGNLGTSLEYKVKNIADLMEKNRINEVSSYSFTTNYLINRNLRGELKHSKEIQSKKETNELTLSRSFDKGYLQYKLQQNKNILEDEYKSFFNYTYKDRARPDLSTSFNIDINHKDNSKRLGISFKYKINDLFNFNSISNFDKNSTNIISTLNVSTKINLDKIIETGEINNIKNINTGSVKGIVFIDSNNNKVHDENEKVMKNLEVFIEGNIDQTDSEGRYFIDSVGINKLNLIEVAYGDIDPSLNINDERFIVKSGQVYEKNVALLPTSSIYGLIQLRRDYLNNDEINNITKPIRIKLIKNDQVIRETYPDHGEFFYFEGIEPGNYKIEASFEGVEKYKEFFYIINPQRELIIKTGEVGEIISDADIFLKLYREE